MLPRFIAVHSINASMDMQQQLHQPDRASNSLEGSGVPCHTVPCQRSTTAGDEAAKVAESKRRTWFENGMKKAFEIPSGYVSVAVLAIRWHADVDEFKEAHDKEVAELGQLFERDFGFTFEEVRLGGPTARNPQNDLNAAIATHVQRYDDRNNLLIIYYTGHGLVRGRGHALELSASAKSLATKDDRYPTTAFWCKAEQVLMDSALADVLAIFDCCYASNAHKGFNEEERMYEFIAASQKDSTTPAPGENSFTSRLIASLRELLKEHEGDSFPTTELVARIKKKNKRLHNGKLVEPQLHDRLEKYLGRNIRLARIDNEAAKQKQKILGQQPIEAARLDLRFSLRDSALSQEQIEVLASELRAAFEKAKIKLCRIAWDKFVPKRMRAEYARRWRNSYIVIRATLNSPATSPGGTSPPALEQMTSRDIVCSPIAISDESESETLNDEVQPLLGSDPALLKDRSVPAMRSYRRLLRYLGQKGAAVLARIRSLFSKESAFCSIV